MRHEGNLIAHCFRLSSTKVEFRPMPSTTVENYAKNIYLVSQKTGLERVAMGDIAEALEVTPGTATTMAKALAKSGLAEYAPRVGVCLTTEGSSLALKILRRHRIIEYFLVNTLKMDWAEIHDEAEDLEHAISDHLLQYLDNFLGNPNFDPHGDPIPSAQGEIIERELQNLMECPQGTQVVVRRIMDQEGVFLKFVQKTGLLPGVALKVIRANAAADCIELELDGGSIVTLGSTAAAKILVEIQ